MGNRSHLPQLREISELEETGIYLLLNASEEPGLTEIYIGETDTSSRRLNQHVRKDWWETFIVFISRDLTKAHVRYLERKLFDLAKLSVSSLKVMNEGIPGGSKLPESDQCAMEEFATNMIFLMESLGLGLFQSEIQAFEPIAQLNQFEKATTRDSTERNYGAVSGTTFYITLPKELSSNDENPKALMSIENGTFILKSGSPIRSQAAGDSFEGSSYHELWRQIISSDAVEITSNERLLKTTRDLQFKSPSAAGAVVRARSTNGRTDWKRATDHKSLFECETEEAA